MRILFFLLFFTVFLSSKEFESITLQLQWKHQFEFAGFYAAKEKGYYSDIGLDVEFKEFESGMDTTQEVLSGKADYATSYSSIILDHLKGKPIVLLANFFKQSPIVLVSQKEIKSPKDLKGKRVMGVLDSTHNKTLLMMLDRFNITQNDFVNINRNFAIDSFIKKDIDAISVFTTNEIFTLNEMGIDYNIFDPAAYGIKFYDINLFTSKKLLSQDPQKVEAFKNASIRGWQYALEHKEEIVELILKKYNTQHKTKEALLFEAKQIEYLMLSNVYPIGSIDMRLVEAIADSYIQTNNDEKLNKEKLHEFVHHTTKQKLFFNQKQKEYLANKQQIKMCVDPNWMPLEKIEEGKHIGIASDVMKEISKKINTQIELVPTHTWSESLEKIQTNECEILAMAQRTPQREEYLNFTIPYIQTPLVIATQIGSNFINDLDKIKDKKLGVVRNYSIFELLKAKYQGINLITVDSVRDGLQKVHQGKLFGFIDNALVINHEIQKGHYSDITINGQFDQIFKLSIASQKDNLVLHQIMQKALLSIEKETIDKIVSQWSNIKYQKTYDYNFIVKVIFAVLILMIIFTYWTFRLKEEIRKKDIVQKKLQESEERFRTLFDLAPVMIDSFDENGKLVLWNKECQKVFGWSKDELDDYEDPINLFYPDEKDRIHLMETMDKAFVYKEWCPITKDGEKLVTMWANIHMPNGEVIHVGYDITEQRKYEQQLNQKTLELEETKKQLEELNSTLEQKVKIEIEKNLKQQLLLLQQNRLAQMGEMIENIAHQWRQPLAQINSCVLNLDAYLDRNNLLQDELVKNKFDEIESLTHYMSKTIDDFKNFFNPDKKIEIFLLNQSVYNALKIVDGALKANYIDTQINVEEELKLNSFMQELEHVFIIILNNAKDALVANKKINDRKITITTKNDDNYIKLYFCDNAGGIRYEHMEKIFEPYFTTKHKTQGTGLGLYMAKMIIEEGLKGKMLAYNVDGGACFELNLPKGKNEH